MAYIWIRYINIIRLESGYRYKDLYTSLIGEFR